MFCHLLVYSGLVTKLCIPDIKQKCNGWVEKVFQGEITRTKPGSIAHLLYGESPSEQSIHIKMGRLGEYLSKELIKSNTQLTLLTCGIQQVHDKKKDVDLIFKDDVHKIVYYRELKGNIELDTEEAVCHHSEMSGNRKFVTRNSRRLHHWLWYIELECIWPQGLDCGVVQHTNIWKGRIENRPYAGFSGHCTGELAWNGFLCVFSRNR